MRPTIQLLDESTIRSIVDQAWTILEKTGVEIDEKQVLEFLHHQDYSIDDKHRVYFTRDGCEKFLESAPSEFRLYGRDDSDGILIGGNQVHYDPGSAAVYWLDPGESEQRRARTEDCRNLAHVTDQLNGFRIQSTGIVPSDVPETIADCHRLLFALIFCRKPVITGTFRVESFRIMKKMLETVAGGCSELRERPMAIFDCCPSPPLRWSKLTLSALLDCARSGIPAEIVSMPLAGATAPVTVFGSIVQHTAECLSAVILHQMQGPGSPIIWGGSPAAFDMRHGTPPMGAMETMMIDLGYSQVGRYLGFPTHTYMACSDSKSPDYQAGMESGIGAVLAALGSINIVSGPGFLNYENTQSLEKLILDHDSCNLSRRLIRGIHDYPDLDSGEIIERNAVTGKFLSDSTTRKYHRQEIDPPGKTVYRSSVDQWLAEKAPTSRDLANRELNILLENEVPIIDDKRLSSLLQILIDTAEKLNVSDQVQDNLQKFFPDF